MEFLTKTFRRFQRGGTAPGPVPALRNPGVVPFTGARQVAMDQAGVCLGDIADLEHGGESEFSRMMPPDIGLRFNLRKWWEWEYIARRAAALECFGLSRSAIGLGTGDEPLIFYFARKFGSTIATDLFSADSEWKEAREAAVEGMMARATIPGPYNELRVENADMRRLPVPEGSMDFAWSTSSIEHVDTLFDVYLIFAELARILKPGGHAVMTTEFCLSRPPYSLPGLNALDASLVESLVGSLGALEIAGPVDLGYNWVLTGNAPRARRYPYGRLTRSLTLREFEGYKGGQMANYCGMSAVTPIGLTLRRTDRPLARWEDLAIYPAMGVLTRAGRLAVERKPAEITALLRPHVEAGPAGHGHQCQALMMRLFMDASAQEGRFGGEAEMRHLARAYRDSLSGSPLQDPDCLDMISHVSWNVGEKEIALDLLRRAVLSPGATFDHAINLAFRYYRDARELNRGGEGDAMVATVVADILINQWPLDDVARTWARATGRLALAEDEASRLLGLVLDRVGAARADLFDTVRIAAAFRPGGR